VRQRGHGVRLALEARQGGRVLGEMGRQDLDGDIAPELRVPRAIDLAHSSGPERGQDLVGAEARASDDRHSIPPGRRNAPHHANMIFAAGTACQ